MAQYDLLIKHGTLIDPENGNVDAHLDIGISGDRIARVADEIFEEEAATVIDASDVFVSPGWIDLHVHVWDGVADLAIPGDPNCVGKGVTTAFDAGSAGADTYPGFQKYVIDVSATRFKAFLHISSQGQLTRNIGELDDLRYADVDRAVKMCEAYKEDIVGIKIRMSRNIVGENGKEGLKRAREVCEATGLPLMLHPNASPLSLSDMFDEMRAGDIMTHCFHKSDTGVIDTDGKVRPEAVKAVQEDGILFDVGHGAGSFAFEVAEAAMSQDLLPGTISSDLHKYNIDGPVYSLALTMSKFLHLGLSLEEVIRKVTSAPAAAMGMLDEIGVIREGTCADLTLFRIIEDAVELRDAIGGTRTGERSIEHVSTVRGGRLYAPGVFD
jgi:dihydroorotase